MSLACELTIAGAVCGSTDDVDRYLPGLRCRPHSPRVISGTPEPTPPGWPEQLRPRPARQYGTATDDPLGRVVFPDSKTGKIKPYTIPSHPCPEGCNRPKGHKLPHDPP